MAKVVIELTAHITVERELLFDTDTQEDMAEAVLSDFHSALESMFFPNPLNADVYDINYKLVE